MSEGIESDSAIPVVLMGFDKGPRDALHDILVFPQWEIREASSYRQAAGMLDGRECGVFICASEVENGTWQTVLADLQSRADPPNLIVSSRLADERLWAEVLNLGGYDVLAQPFDRTEVLRVASMAWMAWRRRYGNVPPRPSLALRAHAS